MPMHDWTQSRGWDGLHLVWQAQLLDWIQPRLPHGYRVYLGSVPALTIDAGFGRPDLSVRRWEAPTPEGRSAPGTATMSVGIAPDLETTARFTLEEQSTLQIEFDGRLIAALEIVSPRNKDRPAARERYRSRYLGYLHRGVHLLLIDVLPLPTGFSFGDAVEEEIALPVNVGLPPFAVSWRVGEPLPEGTVIAEWRRKFEIGSMLPTIPLALSTTAEVLVDLEITYAAAARRLYLS